MIVPGTPIPVIPHAPMRPRCFRSSNAGTTSLTYWLHVVENIDARGEGGVNSRDRLLLGRLTPSESEPTPAERQPADGRERPKRCGTHSSTVSRREPYRALTGR